MSANTFTLLLVAGLLSACGSSDNTTSPNNTQGPAEADSPSSDDTANDSAAETTGESGPAESNNGTPLESDDTTNSTTVETGGESAAIESDSTIESNNGETGESATQDVEDNADDSSTATNSANPLNDGEQADSEAEGTDSEQPIADSQRVNFGPAKLLVDLVPNGDSYPAKFHRVEDKLYFWTIDTDPRFGRCSWHWGSLTDDDKSIAFNLVATHPETGVVTMNKEIMTLGDFAEDPNRACAGYNGSVMQIYKQRWSTPPSANGEQQLVLHFDSFDLGPNQVLTTDGIESNTTQQESGQIEEQVIFEGDKVFFVSNDGLSVSNTINGDRRKLYDLGSLGYYRNITQIVKSPERQATFEIRVGANRYQIWTYDLDTDEWEKKFIIKPDTNTYVHHETLLVDRQTLLSLGEDTIEDKSALGFSSNYGDVTSFEILSDLAPTISMTDPLGTHYNSSENNNDVLFYSTRSDYRVEPRTTSIWSYREEQIVNLFTLSEPDLQDTKVIAGHDGLIYVAATKEIRKSPEQTTSIELWSYNPQTERLVKLSNDDWYAAKYNHSSPDEGYVFRYLNTTDGLMFVNLKDDSGRELWFTDGTTEGTRLLADINPGAGNSDPQNFYHGGDAIYFSANDGIHGREPWMIQISR